MSHFTASYPSLSSFYHEVVHHDSLVINDLVIHSLIAVTLKSVSLSTKFHLKPLHARLSFSCELIFRIHSESFMSLFSSPSAFLSSMCMLITIIVICETTIRVYERKWKMFYKTSNSWQWLRLFCLDSLLPNLQWLLVWRWMSLLLSDSDSKEELKSNSTEPFHSRKMR
jgi:predicted neutral ceramidase superfamily lipid hydrolase